MIWRKAATTRMVAFSILSIRISEKTKRLTDSLQVDIRTLDYKVSNIENLVLRISDDLKTIKDTMGNGAEVSK